MLTVKAALGSRAIVLNEIAEMFKDYDIVIYELLENMRQALPIGEEEYAAAKNEFAKYLEENY